VLDPRIAASIVNGGLRQKINGKGHEASNECAWPAALRVQ